MAPVDDTRLSELDRITLRRGSHAPGGEMCVMEAVAFVAGEPWSDHPACASRVLGEFLRSWNDALDDEDRDLLLKPLIPRLVGTAASDEIEVARSWLALDWLVRTYASALLRRAGMTEHASSVSALPELTDKASMNAALPVIKAARAAAWDAAQDAAQDAAGAALLPIDVELQESALELVDRMIALSENR